MKKTSEVIKENYINNVINLLDRSNKEREIKLISKQNDLTKKYKRAQSFVRENKSIFTDIDLYKISINQYQKNDNGLR